MKSIKLAQHFALVTFAVLGVAALAGGVQAGDMASGPATRAVRYEDLNLNTAAGAHVLYQRIRSAAEQVCGDVASRQLDQAAAAQACVDRAVTSSVRQVNREQLTRTAHEHGYAVETPVSVASR